MLIKKFTIFPVSALMVAFLTLYFTEMVAFEYPGVQKEYNLGARAGARGEKDPCAHAGLICSDAYQEAKNERRIEKRIYDAFSRR